MRETDKRDERVDAAAHLGYVLAILIPVLGFLVGLALIAKSDPDGPWVVGFSLATSLLYGLLVAGRLTGMI